MKWSRGPLRSAAALVRNDLGIESAEAWWGWAVLGALVPVVCHALKGSHLSGADEFRLT